MTAPRETIRELLRKEGRYPEAEIAPDPFRRFLRRNLLLILFTAAFAFFAILVLIQIDRVYYSREKSRVVDALIDEGRLFDEESREDLARRAQIILVGETALAFAPLIDSEEFREEVRAQIVEKMQVVLDRHPFVWRVRVEDAKGRLSTSLENRKVFAESNDWSNSLFYKDWSDDVKFTRRDGTDILLTISTDYTTPRGYTEIEELTAKWRTRALVALALVAIAYAVILRFILLPVRSVIRVLDQGPTPGWHIVVHPRSLLERYYNTLASDANLTILHTTLRDFTTGRVMLDHRAVLEISPALILDLFPLDQPRIITLRREETDDPWRFDVAHEEDGIAALRPAEADLLERRAVDGTLPRTGFEFHVAAEPGNPPQARYAEVIAEDDLMMAIVSLGSPGRRGALGAWWRRLFARIAEELRFGVSQVAEQRRFIRQEKSRANVTLSRNLGHDLTNVIATTKLELMNIRAFMGLSEEDLRGSPKKAEILRQSLQAVLHSTRFLQEIVDLYRSFSYLSRPRFEETDVNAIIEEIGGLFRLATSRNIAVEIDGDPTAPRVEVEPRLLRLALFNLLANSADSIKRSGALEKGGGRILLRVRSGRAAGEVVITVEDNGEGIRHPDGSPMRSHETAAIFKLGYTTKESGGGEGLGLDWVQQIVREFHGGTIEARNIEGTDGRVAGASFRMTLVSGRASATMNPLAHNQLSSSGSVSVVDTRTQDHSKIDKSPLAKASL